MAIEPSTLLVFHFTVGALAALYYLWKGWRSKIFYLPVMIVPALIITALGPVTPLAKLLRKIANTVNKDQGQQQDEGREEVLPEDPIR